MQIKLNLTHLTSHYIYNCYGMYKFSWFVIVWCYGVLYFYEFSYLLWLAMRKFLFCWCDKSQQKSRGDSWWFIVERRRCKVATLVVCVDSPWREEWNACWSFRSLILLCEEQRLRSIEKWAREQRARRLELRGKWRGNRTGTSERSTKKARGKRVEDKEGDADGTQHTRGQWKRVWQRFIEVHITP